ncbi:MAG: AbrB/MazE/SpoVT family DNA-binding domain-containing protein [Victivallales bacterium]
MLMKVFNKGQVVIPIDVRKALNIHLGEMLDIRIDQKRQCIELKKQYNNISKLAGSLSSYASKKEFPDKARMRKLFAEGLAGEKRNN